MSTSPTVAEALRTAIAALAPHADPAAPDTGVTALVHGALTSLEAALRHLDAGDVPAARAGRPGKPLTDAVRTGIESLTGVESLAGREGLADLPGVRSALTLLESARQQLDHAGPGRVARTPGRAA